MCRGGRTSWGDAVKGWNTFCQSDGGAPLFVVAERPGLCVAESTMICCGSTLADESPRKRDLGVSLLVNHRKEPTDPYLRLA